MTETILSRAACAALLTVALGCGGDLTLPDTSGSGLDLSRVGGDEQTGRVGSTLPEPLVVRVSRAGVAPVSGQRVAFVPIAGGSAGSLDPDTAVTNSQGEASSIWVLGTNAGEHRVEARLVVDEAQPDPIVFKASALPGDPDALSAASPVNRAGRRKQPLADPLVVRVADQYGNGVAGARVGWEVVEGKGDLSASETTTGTDGTTQVTWTLGERIGVQEVSASVPGLHGSPVTFTAAVLF